eukprot:CAMPEP_0174827102 /NCGR_PEP_ID=MMETSP1114-20130205/492_1 /TAXON_ID=312471 /ORGANISM="Neobodo designis, Strain CCAP 1951/1" /LENGTH=546 /DNA_ID=CAMNT_0016060707 /DNA_START=199 /DNA_END=1836 /DNA_ORIENTATION=-
MNQKRKPDGGAHRVPPLPAPSRAVNFASSTGKNNKKSPTPAAAAPVRQTAPPQQPPDDQEWERTSAPEHCTAVPMELVSQGAPPAGLARAEASLPGSIADDDDDCVTAEDDRPSRMTGDDDATISDRSSNSAATTASDATNKNIGTTTVRVCGTKVRVPFTVWTFVAMLVPIGLLVAVMAMRLEDATSELAIIADHKPFAEAVGSCGGWLMRERGTLGAYLVSGSDEARATLETNRAGVDAACGDELTARLRELTHKSNAAPSAVWQREMKRHIAMLSALAVWRGEVNARRADGRAVRAFLTDSITVSSEMLTLVADALDKAGRSFAALVTLVATRNYLGLARGVGNAIAVQPPSANVTALLNEHRDADAQAHVAFTVLRGTAEPPLRALLDEWSTTEHTRRMWTLLDTMADPNGGAQRIQRESAAAWWPDVSAGMAALSDVEQAHINRIHSGEARVDVRDSALVMSLGTLACLVAAGLLAHRQSRVRQQLEAQMLRQQRTKAAVSAFVPRFFLHKMGYTSITQARAGDSTNVALAMLFSDIRRFT